MLRFMTFAAVLLQTAILWGDEPHGSLAIELSAKSYANWRDHILPTDAESAFQALPWELSFADGLAAAAEQRKPLLLWVMNGHPLGCT